MNVEEIFIQAAKALYKNYIEYKKEKKQEEKTSAKLFNKNTNKNEKKNGCC